MMSVERVAIFWVVNASSGKKSCLQFSIPTESGAGGEGGVSHSLKNLPLNFQGFFLCAKSKPPVKISLSFIILKKNKITKK